MIKRALFVIFGLLALCVLAFFVWPESRYQAYQVSEAYQKQVDAFVVPEMPSDWQWSAFAGDDGIRMRWGQTGNADAAKATVVIVPGYTATLDMYGEHVSDLAARGYHVLGFDLRGQGGSERPRVGQPEKLLIDDFSRYSNELSDFIQSRNLPEDRSVIVMGMSFGGHVATRMAGDHPDTVDGLLLLAPALKPKAGDMTFEEAAKLLTWGRKLGKDTRYLPGASNWTPYNEENLLQAGIEHCSSNPKRLPLRDAIFTRKPEQRVGDVTFNWGGEFYESSLYVRNAGYPESIELPVTMIHAELDNFVDTDENKLICDTRMPNCQSLPIAGTGHCLPQESDAVLEEIFDALDGVLGRIQNRAD